MPAIGITGGVATGKTTFCDRLREVIPAARFYNADEAARELADRDPEVQQEIREGFGPDIYSDDGHLNRAKLRAIVFQDAALKSVLEQILHPRIRRQWSTEARTYRSSSDFFFADIPLLYETGGETLCDFVVVVACSPEIQLQRLLARGPGGRSFGDAAGKGLARARPSMDSETARKMIESQMPLTDKIQRADHVVWNDDGPAVLGGQAKLLAALWQK